MRNWRRWVLKAINHPCYVCGRICPSRNTPEWFECWLTMDWRETHPILARILLP